MKLVDQLKLSDMNWCKDEIERLERELATERALSFRAQVAELEKEYGELEEDRDEWKARAEFSYQERNKLERERDELLALLKETNRLYSNYELVSAGNCGAWINQLRNAIASVKESK